MEYFFYVESLLDALKKATLADVPNDTNISRLSDCRVRLGHAEVLARVCSGFAPHEAHIFDMLRSIVSMRSKEKLLTLQGVENLTHGCNRKLYMYSSPSGKSHADQSECCSVARNGANAATGTVADQSYDFVFDTLLVRNHLRNNESTASLEAATHVYGLEEAKQLIHDCITLPLILGDTFNPIIRPPKSILLHGLPGCGKTKLVETSASKLGVNLLPLTPGFILSKWSGESEKLLQAAFRYARKNTPCIIFIDEIDSLCSARETGAVENFSRTLLSEFLILFSGLLKLPSKERLFIMGATNCMSDIDKAVLRRFESRIEIPQPGFSGRKSMIESYLQATPNTLSSSDIEDIAKACEGWNGSEILQLCRNVAMKPIREMQRSKLNNEISTKTSDSSIYSSEEENIELRPNNVFGRESEGLVYNLKKQDMAEIRKIHPEDFESLMFACGPQASKF